LLFNIQLLTSKAHFLKAFVLQLFLFFCLSLSIYAQSTGNKLFVIGNNTGIKTMTLNQVKEVFHGKIKNWTTNVPIKIALPSSKSIYSNLVAKEIYSSTYNGMQKYWLALVFQGKSKPPVFLDTNRQIIDYVSKNKGAIGILFCNPKDVSPNIILYHK
jgi:hypothetical protein